MKLLHINSFLKNKKTRLFYSQPRFKEFAKVHTSFKTKYYKGLGTSSEKEVLDTFGKRTQTYFMIRIIKKNLVS